MFETLFAAPSFFLTEIPQLLEFLAIALIAFLVGRASRKRAAEMSKTTHSDVRRAKHVAEELERISWALRRNISKHHAYIMRYKERLNSAPAGEDAEAWESLCREAEEILRPTQSLAGQLSHAYEEIRQQSHMLMNFSDVRTDALTGVQNRRALEQSLDAQFRLMLRYGTAFAVALFDIDHFKRVNDEQGHLLGDEVLQRVAEILSDSARETDIVARYGGEEFVVLMPQTDLESAGRFADRVREAVEEKTPVTVSAGVASALKRDSREQLLARADSSMYEAKASGRNTVFLNDGKTPRRFDGLALAKALEKSDAESETEEEELEPAL